MKTVTMYEAEDRARFSTEAACLEYEQQWSVTQREWGGLKCAEGAAFCLMTRKGSR